ncbi:MAG: hypothetical protein WA777_21050 [Rhodanobacter sp.]
MSQNAIITATNNVRVVNGKKDPSATYGFQVCGLKTGPSMFQQFDRMYSPSRGEKPLPEGEYEVAPKPAYIDQKGNLRIGYELVPVKAASRAA